MTDEKNYKAGFVSILGLPNSGKSTLINQLCNAHLSAVSPKPQTTRFDLKGIKTTRNYQIVFIDTPGFLTPKTRLEKIMSAEFRKAAKDDSDLIILVFEPFKKIEDESFFKLIAGINKPLIVAINKIDIYNDNEINESISILKKILGDKDYIKISAKNKTNLKELEELIVMRLPYSPPYYYDDILSDRWERYFVSELIREEIFLKYEDEIPYNTIVNVELFKEDVYPYYILANIYVSKKSHKPIIIGRKGSAIKKLREDSEKKIEEFLNKKVKLELSVKVRENWINDENFINNLMKDYR